MGTILFDPDTGVVTKLGVNVGESSVNPGVKTSEFAYAMVALIVGAALIYLGKSPDEVWKFIASVTGVYVGGRSGVKAAAHLAAGKTAAAASTPVPPPTKETPSVSTKEAA